MTEQQRAAIHIDPVTGHLSFDTRASRPGRAITGSGYRITSDESLKVLPPPPTGAVFDAAEQATYRAYKEARRGRPTTWRWRVSSPATWSTRTRASRCLARG